MQYFSTMPLYYKDIRLLTELEIGLLMGFNGFFIFVFEMPLIAKKLVETKKYDAVIALGAVIKGSTPHFDYVCAEVSKGIATVSMDYGMPVIFGVLTTNTIEQAIERAGTKAGNKGFDAGVSAIEMVNLIQTIG